MKSIKILVLLLLCAFSSQAQDFEGIIKMAIEVKGEQAEMIKAYMPTGMEVKVKGLNSHTMIAGGMMVNETVTNNGVTYMIDAKNKTAQKMPSSSELAKQNDNVKLDIKKLDEKVTILGYPTEKYAVTSQKDGKNMTIFLWVTNSIALPSAMRDDMYKGVKGMEQIKGFPLKTEMNIEATETSATTIIMTVSSIDKVKVADSDVQVPKDYAISDFNPAEMMKQMGIGK